MFEKTRDSKAKISTASPHLVSDLVDDTKAPLGTVVQDDLSVQDFGTAISIPGKRKLKANTCEA